MLFNLGGPDAPAAVEPFLFNLFSDKAIIALPNPLRWLIARVIARRRAPVARAIYGRIGGASPILPNTEAQARALESTLGPGHRVFIAMRYWHPRARETARAVKDWGPERIVLLPLYPQFSSTTTLSSLAEWRRESTAVGLAVPVHTVCCYPENEGFISSIADEIRSALRTWPPEIAPRVLLSAHGLPKRVVERGDSYQWQIERTAAAIRATIGRPDLDMVVCYQSRVGPLEWLQPATEGEIRRAAADRVGLIVAPIAFVSEHSETLVELDLEYRRLADALDVPHYVRVPTVGAAVGFIGGLAKLVVAALAGSAGSPLPEEGHRRCPPGFGRCPCAGTAVSP